MRVVIYGKKQCHYCERAKMVCEQRGFDYEYYQMINLANLRKNKMIDNKYFKDQNDFENHIDYIKEEDKKLDFDNRTREVRNWLEIIK